MDGNLILREANINESCVTTYATGVFVDDTTIITAGHAIYYRQNDTVLGYATSVTVYPGGTSSSFGSSTAVQLATTASWISSGDKGGDYGVITISSSMGTGYYGMSALSDTQLNGKSVYCTGYPGDKDDSTLWN
ncbi:MAG: hypothetical protein LUG86_01850 [Oscillospiraceae bacterium]|nr:hypothetical protein [Oscillospiraceae bacterium]